jgi:ABC-type nitrate/sulfonate/bicarbonate transport system permease component
MAASSLEFWEDFKKRPASEQKRYIRIVSLIAVIIVWEAIGQTLGNLFFATLSDVAVRYYELALYDGMFQTLLGTMEEMAIAFVIAVATGLPIGLLMGRNKTIEQLLNPLVSAMFVTATAALLPLFIILFGIDFKFRLAITYVSCVWFILLNAYHGAAGVDRTYIDTGQSFKASRFKIFKDIVFPATLPYIYAGMRMGLIHAIRGIILAETFIAAGYGGRISAYAHSTADTAPVLALILTIMFLGYGLRIGLERLQWYLFPWSDPSEVVG